MRRRENKMDHKTPELIILHSSNYLSEVVSLHSTRYVTLLEWPVKKGVVQESLTEVEVRGFTRSWLGG